MKPHLALIVLATSVIAPAAVHPASAQAPSEMQQRFACMGDAMRLCPRAIPNRDAIIRCMAAQRDALSAGCRPVFDASYRALGARPPR